MLKGCNTCGITKEFSDFYSKNRLYPTSLASISSDCKVCVRQKRNDYVKFHISERKKADRRQHLKRYGLTPEAYNSLFEKQQGKCLGCERHQTEFDRKLSVDHDHVTGIVRGLLCVTCNFILGYAKDDPYLLVNLIDYLVVHNPELAGKNTNVVEGNFSKKVG